MTKSPATIDWRNRIVRYAMESPDQLLAHPMNARIHPKAQQSGLEGTLDTIGIIAPVIINTRTQHCIDGHLRIQMAISRGQKEIPVVYVDLDESEEALALATFDYITSLAVYDKDLLNTLMDDISTDNTALQMLLSNMAEEHHIIPPLGRDDDGDGEHADSAPSDESDVRMVYLFLNAAQADDFSSMTKRLSEAYSLTTLTDTVFECVKRAYEDTPGD